MTKLQFVGDLGLWLGLIVALAAAALAWRVYRREVNRAGLDPSLKWKLPLLRGLAVFMLMMMLTGPVLMHRELVGQVARVLVFVDGSQSMTLDDRHMEPGRKLVLVQRAGWLPPDKVDPSLIGGVEALEEARRAALEAADAPDRTALKRGADTFVERVEAAVAVIEQVNADAVPVPRLPRGTIARQVWNANTDRVDDKTIEKVTAGEPATSDTLNAFDSPENFADNYLQRIYGFVHPPQSGDYVFYLGSDDESVLYLSTDERPERKQKIAGQDNSTSRGNYPAESKPIKLEAGRVYYIEAVQREGSGNDFLQVGWRLPGGQMQRPIPGEFLSPAAEGGASPAQIAQRLRDEVAGPADEVADTGFAAADDQKIEQVRTKLRELASAVATYETSLRRSLDGAAEALLAADDATVKAAFDRFDTSPRWDRIQRLLLDGQDPTLARLAGKHDVELISLTGPDARRLWTPTTDSTPPSTLTAQPTGVTSNLTTGVREKVIGTSEPGVAANEAPTDGEQRTAAVIISDGRHNDGESPAALARVLGDRKVPVFTVGIGSGAAPKDMAVLGVETPQTVYKDDRVRGRVLIADHMPPGRPFTLRITHDGQTLWSQQLNTAGVDRRYVDYDFPIAELVKAQLDAADDDLTINALPLDMKAVIDPIEGEQRADNNSAPMSFRAATQRRQVLIVDSRPRWETRYIANMFERDERWEANLVLVGPATERDQLRRGDKPGEYPADRESLFGYDLIVLGEVPANRFESAELEALRDFVATRGGGLVLLDGRRGLMRTLVGTPMEPIIPVAWPGGDDPAAADANAFTQPDRLELTDAGSRVAALNMAPDTEESDRFWRIAPPPRHVVAAEPLPGAETLVDAVRGEDRRPVLVFRQFGAGRVLYSTSDEFWRWRYNVADRYHQRLWHQLANWIMEQPYAVADQYVSLDAGGPVYRPGDRARLRVRLRDAEGKPVLHATVQAVIWSGDKRVSTVTLDAEESVGGAFRGQTEPLPAGDWRVTVEVTGFADEQIKAQTKIRVAPPETGEMALLTMNEDLLRRMAVDSGGRFLREEEASRLPELMEPLSAGRIVESETALWQSYWWFLPMIAFLGLEWFLRKRAGMI